jgi:endonuclease VIII-like 1
MPEAPEIKMYTDFLNYISEKSSCVGIQKMPQSKNKDISFSVLDPELGIPSLKLRFESKGKEIGANFLHENGSLYKRYLFQMGMSGYWLLCDEPSFHKNIKIKNNTVLRFLIYSELTDIHGFLCLVDTRRFAKWSEVTPDKWGNNRGPDPFYERDQFKENILFSLHQKDFGKPIYETLMNQKYFNGIGNYLRAVICGRIDETPFQSARDYIKKDPDLFFDTIWQVIDESYDMQIKNATPSNWYSPYDDKKEKNLEDSNGRRFWYKKKWDPDKNK